MVMEEIRDLGDRILGLGRREGRGGGGGAEVDMPLAIISDVRDGKAWRSRTFLDHGEELRAAGLEDEAMSANVDLLRSIYADWESRNQTAHEHLGPLRQTFISTATDS